MKYIAYFVVGILILSGFSVLGMSGAGEKHKTLDVSFSEPTLSEKDGFVEISMDGATTQLFQADRPVLPIYVKTYEIPFRSTDIQVLCTAKSIGTMTLSQEIIPARIAPVSSSSEQVAYVMDPVVYGSAAFYPDAWFTYDLGAGRDEQNAQVTFVKVVCYPVRYAPLDHQLMYAGGFDIQVTYQEPTTPLKTISDEYDLLIIAPAGFESSLQPLIDHKNSKGVATMFKSVEDIIAEYDGYDQPEQIKYFIEHEYNTSNITYVLLVGGLKSHMYAKDKDTASAGWKAWRVPVRYVNMPQEDDPGCLCDLYYGCLYNATGAFDSWDTNGDGIYAQWKEGQLPKDKFDLYPEVYVSRIPAVTVSEVKSVVKKIVTYESTGPAEKSWYKNFVGVGGQTSGFVAGYPDGQYLCDLAYNYTKHAIPDLTLTKCYATLRDVGGRTPIPKYILKSFNEGAGFIDFEGHGNPYSWNTIWHDGVYPKDWAGGFNIYLYPLLINGNKLPVVVVGGCHNALYNVSVIPGLLENKTHHPHFIYGFPLVVPVCFSAGLVTKAHGGAIASTGCTGYGWGESNNPNTLSGALEMNFFWNIGYNNVTNLATAHSLAITKYINENDISGDQLHAFCITNWAIIGDASLRLGGYSS